MKSILYILVDRAGKIETFEIPCQQNEPDYMNLSLWGPENLRGKPERKLARLLKAGYSLSNWHVIERSAKEAGL